jgi:hypothetical protein
VGRADARALVATVAVVLGGCTLLSIPNWPAAAAEGGVAAPREAMILLFAAGALVALLLLADGVALRRVERLSASMDALDGAGGEPAAGPSAGRVDLGLGDEIAAQTAPGTAYRGGGREVTCIRGDFEEAAAALRQSLRRGALMLALLEAVGLAHGAARATDLAADYGAWLCDGGRGRVPPRRPAHGARRGARGGGSAPARGGVRSGRGGELPRHRSPAALRAGGALRARGRHCLRAATGSVLSSSSGSSSQ